MTALPGQQTLQEALTRPCERRVFVHAGCGGFVLFGLEGGTCLHCGSGPLHVGDYEKPAA